MPARDDKSCVSLNQPLKFVNSWIRKNDESKVAPSVLHEARLLLKPSAMEGSERCVHFAKNKRFQILPA